MWSLIRRWGEQRRASLERSISRCIVLPYDNDMSRHWAQLTAHRRMAGRPIECGDAWIAATALTHGLPPTTHNAGDYTSIPGLTIVSYPDC
jgi:predicted nucleic acid-binding protein